MPFTISQQSASVLCLATSDIGYDLALRDPFGSVLTGKVSGMTGVFSVVLLLQPAPKTKQAKNKVTDKMYFLICIDLIISHRIDSCLELV